jgi:hypothetical protein
MYKCGSNMLPYKLKSLVIRFVIQLKTYTLMNKIDQGMKTTSKRRVVVTIHLTYIPFTNFEYYHEITNTSSNLEQISSKNELPPRVP